MIQLTRSLTEVMRTKASRSSVGGFALPVQESLTAFVGGVRGTIDERKMKEEEGYGGGGF